MWTKWTVWTSNVALLLLSLIVGAVGCGVDNTEALRVGNGAEPQELDPHIISGALEHRIVAALFEGLADVDPETLEPVPAVAESWEVSADRRVYTFFLRPTAAWSNGDPVTAQDFVYSWRRILTPALGSEYAYMLNCIKNAKAYQEGKITDFSEVGVRAVDPRILEVTLNDPTPYFLSMQMHFTYFPVHRPTIERFGRIDERNTKWTRPGNLIGNGAFTLKRWIPNNALEVVKNERYWNAAQVRLPRIVFYPIDNIMTEERSFRTGQLHLTSSVPIPKIAVYQSQNPDLIHLDPYLATYFYRLNVTRAPLNDVRIRRALAMSIDRKSLVENVLKGGQLPAYALTVPGAGGYTCASAIEYNVQEARRLLAEAGYPDGQGMPRIELLYNTSESHKLVAEALQRMWKKNLGIDIALVNQDWKVYLATLKNLDYQIARAGWIGDYNDPNNFLECFLTNGGNNRTGWSSKEYDDLIAEATRTPDNEARLAIFQRAERILLDEVPIIPIYYYTQIYLKSAAVQGWHSNLLGYVSFKHLYFEGAT